MIILIHLVAYTTATNQRLWHEKYHESLWYAQIKGMVICVYLYTHKSIHTCTLCIFLKCFWTIILCMAFGEGFWSSILADVCHPVEYVDCISVFCS